MGGNELDPDTLAEAYRNHGRALLRFLARRTYDAEAALDLTAETFARAWRARRRYRGTSPGELERWLYTIAANALTDYVRSGRVERRALRRLGLERPDVADDDLARVEELAGLDELRGRVAAELTSLTGTQRRAIELRIVDERSYAEVADTLGLSPAAARAHVSRGLRALGERLYQDVPPTRLEVHDG